MKIQIIVDNPDEVLRTSINNYFLKGHIKVISDKIKEGYDFYYFLSPELEITHFVGDEILNNVVASSLPYWACSDKIEVECHSIAGTGLNRALWGGKYDSIKDLIDKSDEEWEKLVLERKFKVLDPSYCHPELDISVFPKKIIHRNQSYYKNLGLIESWWDKNYENIPFIEKWGDYKDSTRQYLNEIVKANEISSILDFGCGFCHEEYLFSGKIYKGVDNSKKIVKFSQDLGLNAEFGDIETIKLDKFDLVYIKDVIEHLSGFEKIIKNSILHANKAVIAVFSIKPGKNEQIKIVESGIFYNTYKIDKIEAYLRSFDNISWEWENVEDRSILYISKGDFKLNLNRPENDIILVPEKKTEKASTHKKVIVVARYKEDISWIETLDKSFHVVVYNKEEGENLLPNIGREAHTYLHYIVENYDNLGGMVIFTQGKPFDHVRDFVDKVNKLEFKGKYQSLTLGSNAFDNKGHPPIKRIDKNGEMNRIAHHIFSEILGYPHPSNVYYNPFAIFAVDKDTILKRNKYFYLRLLSLLTATSNIGDKDQSGSGKSVPYVIERLWKEIFGVEKEEQIYLRSNVVNKEWFFRQKQFFESYKGIN